MPLNGVPSLQMAVTVFVSWAWLVLIGTARPKMRIAESTRFRIAASPQHVATGSLSPLGSRDHEINLAVAQPKKRCGKFRREASVVDSVTST